MNMPLNQANYASTDPRPTIWAVKHKETTEVLETHENLQVLKNKYTGDDYLFTKTPIKLA